MLNSMPNLQTIKFIDGTFSTEEAEELLMNLLSEKIQFHEMKNFSAQERYGSAIPGTAKRIEELQDSMEKLIDIINQAEENGMQLKIASSIQIESITKSVSV